MEMKSEWASKLYGVDATIIIFVFVWEKKKKSVCGRREKERKKKAED